MEQHQHYQSLQDQAYNALRSKIIYAELKPGTRLSAIGLEKETGIGRTPIRESFVRVRILHQPQQGQIGRRPFTTRLSANTLFR